MGVQRSRESDWSAARTRKKRSVLVAIMQLKHEFSLRYFLAYCISQNARFLEQLAPANVHKVFSRLEGTARRHPVVLARERFTLEHESEHQHPIVSIDDEWPRRERRRIGSVTAL